MERRTKRVDTQGREKCRVYSPRPFHGKVAGDGTPSAAEEFAAGIEENRETPARPEAHAHPQGGKDEIGRASCRERVSSPV